MKAADKIEINPKIFKAYDIRGVYPSEINEETVFEIVQKMTGRFGAGSKIVIGHDDRISSPSLYSVAIKAAKTCEGIKVIEAGLVTTPMLYFLVNYYGADGGFAVTASHNPKEYNGIKTVKKNAIPVSGKDVLGIVTGAQYEANNACGY